jgi:hypothetical protein
MNTLKSISIIATLALASTVQAQSLSAKDKTVNVEDLPEYVVINCDNATSIFGRSIRIVIQANNSAYAKPLKDLQDLLEGSNYLQITNQTDLLNTLSTLGFDYLDAFSHNSEESSTLSRTGFVFRKKEKYRN